MMPQEEVQRRISNAIPPILTNIFSSACLLAIFKESSPYQRVGLCSANPSPEPERPLDDLAPRILKRNFDPGFFVDHFVKDLGIALEEARRTKLHLPGVELANRFHEQVHALGHGRYGTHALMLALEGLSHTQH